MLGKLIKHEFKAVTNVMLLINGCTLLLSLIGCLTFVSPLWEIENDYIPMMAAFSVIVYYIAIIAISFASAIYLMLRFYKNLYTDEGYLMHTLPVTPRQLILSKGITAFCWLAITAIMIGLSIVSIMLSACLKFMDSYDLREMFRELPYMFQELYGMGTTQYVTLMIIVTIISTASGLLMIYASISLGQLFSKHKIISSVGCYVLFHIITQVINMIAMMPYYSRLMNPYSSSNSMDGYLYYVWITTAVIALITGVIYYVITEYIMTKKLNLE